MKIGKKDGKIIFCEGDREWQVGAVSGDAGIDGAYLFGSLKWQSYDGFCATALPSPEPTGRSAPPGMGDGVFRADAEGVTVTVSEAGASGLELAVCAGRDCILTGAVILLSGIEVAEDGYFEFPGNLPLDRFYPARMKPFEPVCTWFYGTALHLWDGRQHINLLYRNTVEKWVSGGWTDRDGRLTVFFLPAAECRMRAGTVQTFGCVTVQLPEGDPYREISGYFRSVAPQLRCLPELYGPMYCCHPYGTTDTGYAKGQTFAEYAAELPALREMGIRTVYVLPVYRHKGKTDIYSPDDLSVIDARYGGESGAKRFVRAAHDLGMKVIFDFVPHGPEPDSPLALSHADWCAKRIDGSLQSEWDCVSFDACNPAYQRYLTDIVSHYAAELELDGMRIDCAMGGCANWNPDDPARRPSASSLAGGVAEIRAIREGFDRHGRDALLMPEMTNPLPDYLPETECFYNNTLYRVLMELNARQTADRTLYTQTLLRWLSVQNRSRPRGQVMANWLENHDTVLWAGDAKRAEKMYGPGLTENMFRLIAWIDGFPVIYQGDEDPGAYGLEGRDLREFFRQTFALRERYLPYWLETEYLPSGKPVMAFRRCGAGKVFTVLLNLSDLPQEWELPGVDVLFAENAGKDGDRIRLSEYGAVLAVSRSHEERRTE